MAPAKATDQTVPPPLPSSPLLLFARWTALADPSPDPLYDFLRWESHHYKLAIRPTEPITLGRRVRILAIVPITHHIPDTPSTQYDTYDTHVIGRVVEMNTKRAGCHSVLGRNLQGETTRRTRDVETTMVITIRNECCGNTVRNVFLEFPEADDEAQRTARTGQNGKRSVNEETESRPGRARGQKRRKGDGGPSMPREDEHWMLLASIRPWPCRDEETCSGKTCFLEQSALM